ncbi:MAG: hypothetical protein CL840_14225 [Crocinitomicaceae bacterium]|nr:hypothetical protein [Crocinitomicaceae bacterium]|tara:strand:- start:6638 stop:7042 length:405 start_codon:yes stop_codon:yes gene_type:complete
MTREERLKSCRICTNRKLNLQKGLLCGLTDEFAAFEDDCQDFNKDKVEVNRQFEMKMAAAGDGRTGVGMDYKFNKILGLSVVLVGVLMIIFLGIGILTIIVLLYGGFTLFRGMSQEKIFLKHQEESNADSKADE